MSDRPPFLLSVLALVILFGAIFVLTVVIGLDKYGLLP